LLETNGYPFRFVGRQFSSAVLPSFTKVNHEGYCGSVIAPPGVFAVHGYNTADAYLLKIVADALAITNNRPDLVLLLIGANDIGRGRDPYQVATNDMASLLDLIFTNVPEANVILARITSLQDANLPGFNYAAYATNVPIYNAALQTMVNQRRGAGQNVFLADMFSAVDYNTMFLPDHVHPNGAGLRSMANEWFARIQAITLKPQAFTSTLIHAGDNWKYYDAGQEPGTNWQEILYDDTGWRSGPARLGYGDPAVTTTISYGTDPTNRFVTTYFRHPFFVPWNFFVTNLNVRLARADGAAVWLNGQELYRTNLPSGPLSYTTLATARMTGFTPQIFYPLNRAVAGLPAGTNFLAVEVHKSAVTNPVFGFDLELATSGFLMPDPLLSISGTGAQFLLSWPETNGNSFSLFSATNLDSSAGWSAVNESAQTNAGQITVTQPYSDGAKFFRLARPNR
jgi:lysophospholipase L1-like esterase